MCPSLIPHLFSMLCVCIEVFNLGPWLSKFTVWSGRNYFVMLFRCSPADLHPSPGFGASLVGTYIKQTGVGLRFPSLGKFSLNPPSSAWQAYEQRCLFSCLRDESHQPPVDQVSKVSSIVYVAEPLTVTPVLYPFVDFPDPTGPFKSLSLDQEDW